MKLNFKTSRKHVFGKGRAIEREPHAEHIENSCMYRRLEAQL
jgi:hypothetical protein